MRRGRRHYLQAYFPKASNLIDNPARESNRQRMFHIGSVTLPYPFLLAPMAGVTDLPFRLISRSFGAPLAFTEMIDARAINQRDKRTRHMLSSTPEDRPLGVQFLAAEEEDLIKALALVEALGFDLIDLNAACPAPKVTRRGKGAALLKEPGRLAALLKALVDHTRTPVTVKIRAGWDECSVNAVEVALMAEDAGIAAIFIHGRTKVQGYGGTVDYDLIRRVREALRIPVIASGDNLSVAAVDRMFNDTGCHAVAIARGALGNPWIFRDVVRFFEDGTVPAGPTVGERIEVMKRHLELVIGHYGERRGVASFHKFFIWYTRGLRDTRPFRDQAFRANTRELMVEAIDALNECRDA